MFKFVMGKGETMLTVYKDNSDHPVLRLNQVFMPQKPGDTELDPYNMILTHQDIVFYGKESTKYLREMLDLIDDMLDN